MDIRNHFLLRVPAFCALLFIGCGSSPLRPTAGSGGAGTAGPAPAPGTPDAVVEISEFRVYPESGLDYVADLKVSETGGRSRAVIDAVELTLVDLGSSGRVPWSTSAVLPAGGSVVLLSSAPDAYGNAQFSFGGSQPSSRFSVTIHFRDDAGRAGSVTAATSVTNR